MGKSAALKKAYQLCRRQIEDRLSQFGQLKDSSHERFFEELCFCLLTPQSKAESCALIISDLKKKGLLQRGTKRQLEPLLKRTRFYRKKTRFLLLARRIFSEEEYRRFKMKLSQEGPVSARRWLVENIKGLGYKEASHFLRNIGFGEDLAILDVHVLRRLKELGVINEPQGTLSPSRYLAIEEKLRRFAKSINIPMSHLDVLIFSSGSGQAVAKCK